MRSFFNDWYFPFGIKRKIPGETELTAFSAQLNDGLLKREDLNSLLRQVFPRLKNTPTGALDRLIEVVGNQPLALILASLYLEESALLSPNAYISTLGKTTDTLPESFAKWAAEQHIPYAKRLAATFLLSVRHLQSGGKVGRLAGQLLRLASYCAPNEPIPTDFLRESLHPINERAFTRALNRAYRLGLLQNSEQQPVIHPQIAVLARLLDDSEKSALRGFITTLLAKTGEAWQPEKAEPLLPLLPHLESVAVFAEIEGQQTDGKLWNNLGHLHKVNHQFDRARESFERALAADEQAYGAQHVKIASDCCELGRVSHDLGDLMGAKAFFERALAVQETATSRENPGVAKTCVCLGQVLHKLGELQRAKELFERAQAIHIKTYDYGPKHPDTAIDLHQLGLVLFDMGKLAEAKACFEQALDINEWVFGIKHTSITENLHQLGRVLRAQGALVEARACFERLMLLESKISGRDGQPDPIALNQLGLVMQDLGKLAEARACFEQALSYDIQEHGDHDPSVARDVNNLGCVLRDLGELSAARDCFQQALTITENLQTPNQREITIYANNLGRVLYSLKDLTQAKACFDRVLAADEHIYGPDHQQLASDAANLGTVLQDLGAPEPARAYFQRALAILVKTVPHDHPRLLSVQRSLKQLNPQV